MKSVKNMDVVIHFVGCGFEGFVVLMGRVTLSSWDYLDAKL